MRAPVEQVRPPARPERADDDPEMRTLVRLLEGDALLSLHRPQQRPLRLASMGYDAELADDLLAGLDARLRFERRRRGDRDRMDAGVVSADGRVAEVTAWSYPLQLDVALLLTIGAGIEPPAWLDAYVDLWWRRRCEAAWNDGLGDTLDLVDLGVVVLDGQGGIGFANRSAERLLLAGDGVRRLGGSLGATAFEDAVRLQTALGMAIQPDGRPTPLLTLRRSRGRPIVAAVTRMTGSPAHLCDPAAIVYLLDPDLDTEGLLTPVCEAYGLTTSETQLAKAIVAGSTLAEAAGAQRIRIDTARSYLKNIFAKTGTHRQAELVRVMLSGVLRAGTGTRR